MDVVIGAAFGDEGKGLMTHYLASQHGQSAVVVRFNGGAQAGHTVVTQNNQRHVFRHIGSGAFTGATTYLSQFFVSNPILFLQEMKQLHHLGLKPKVYIDPASVITTPYDMIINQMVEELRGNKRHGSCGVGFAETIERNLHAAFSLTVADLEDKKKVEKILQAIRKHWVPQRLKTLNISEIPKNCQSHIASDEIAQLFLHDLSTFLTWITVSRLDLHKLSYPIIFEGAQGLMLDQERGWFPHVTRSHTGLKNVLKLIKTDRDTKLNVIYVTRSYLTRHGAGPLPFELSNQPYKHIIDKTNIPNAHQGALRYAWFNLNLINAFIQSDLAEVPSTIQVKHRIAVTCLDQADEQISFVEDNKLCKEQQITFLQKLAKKLKVSEILCSYGPTIDTLKQYNIQDNRRNLNILMRTI